MIIILLLALGLGFVAGLRTFTAPAAVMLVRGGIAGYILSVLAVGEYVADALPKTPLRTAFPWIRLASGAFSGWMIAAIHNGPVVAGAIFGIIGTLIGTYGGLAARLAAIARIGAIPAAIVEDIVAIALAAFFVTR